MDRETISAKEAVERLHETGNISYCTIQGVLYSTGQVFKKPIHAEHTIFEDQVSWLEVTFKESVFHNDAVFYGKTSWTGAHFKKDVLWVKTVFRGATFWDSVVFGQNAFWDDAIFKGKILVSSREIFDILQGAKAGVYISLEDYRKRIGGRKHE